MDLPSPLFNQNIFYTDIKSLLRGLNALNGSSQARIRSIRVDKAGIIFKATGILTLIKMCLITSLPDRETLLDPEIIGIHYDDQVNSYKLLKYLSGDSKESLLIKEGSLDAKKYLDSISNTLLIRKDHSNYSNCASACIDSYQINQGVIFLFHDSNDTQIILNRALVPNPEKNYESFCFYTKVYILSDSDNLKANHNFIQIDRKSLEISGGVNSSLDLSQLILPIIHIYPEPLN